MVIEQSEFKDRRDRWLQNGINAIPSEIKTLPTSKSEQSRVIKFPNHSKQRFSQNSSLPSISRIIDEDLPKTITDELRQKLLSNPKLAHLYLVRAQRERINNPSPEANTLCKEYEELYIRSKMPHSKKAKPNTYKEPNNTDQLTY